MPVNSVPALSKKENLQISYDLFIFFLEFVLNNDVLRSIVICFFVVISDIFITYFLKLAIKNQLFFKKNFKWNATLFDY